MRTHYLLDNARRRAGDAVRRFMAQREQADRQRRRRLALAAGVLLLGGGAAWALWRMAFAPPAVPAPVAQASVPAHQQSGPLANPWGPGTPVVGERGAEGAAAASTAAAASSAPVERAVAARPEALLATPAGREALRVALARLRGTARAADFVQPALQATDPAALAVAWMAERQCRQVAQWRLMAEWQARALNPGMRIDPAAPASVPGMSAQLRGLVQRCADMPVDNRIEEALVSAGFASTSELTEPTRRPLDLARAVAVGDAVLLATVLDASTAEEVGAWVAARVPQRGPAEQPPDVLKSAFWLASCRAGEGAAAAGGNTPRSGAGAVSGAQRAACGADHPAVWQACMQQGLCDARDLHDMLLRTLSTEDWHASERLARQLVPLMGR